MKPIHVPSFGPDTAEYAAVGQSPGQREGEQKRPFVGPAGSLARVWLAATGLNPDTVYWANVYEYVLLGGEQPSATDVKHGIERIKRELAALPNLKAVLLFGSYAARCAMTLKGGITRAHGKRGLVTLPDGREVPCIVCLHPSYVLRQTSLRQRQVLDSECRSVVARLTFLDKPLELPVIRVVDQAIVSGFLGLDTETASQVGDRPDPRRDPLLLTGLSDGRVIVGPPAFAPDAEPVIHNAPFDPVVLEKATGAGYVAPRWHDSKVLAHLVGEADTTMKSLASRLLNRPMMDYDADLRARAADTIRRGETDTDTETFAAYCAQDAAAHRDLYETLWRSADKGTRFLYETVERPMIGIYSKWTAAGVFRLDHEAAARKRDAIDGQIRQMRRDLQAATGVDSPHKHTKLALALGLESTSAVFVARAWGRLTKRQREILLLINKLRSVERQVSTYIDAWLAWPDPLLSTDWRPTAAWTGRAGSAHLNLQNIPAPCGDCNDCRRQAPCPFDLRPLLLPPPGTVLYELDNSQAELRVAAHLSQDSAMIQAFTEGIEIEDSEEPVYDLHAWAQKRLGIISRKEAKIRVLATFYGQTEQGVSAAPEIQEAIRRIFVGYFRWTEKVKRLAIVPGLFGRRLYVPPHPDAGHREREAINAPSQGGAVDMVKLQTIALERHGFDTRHMIHDSVLIAVPEADAGDEVRETMIHLMESEVALSVPVRVEGGVWPK